MEPTILVSSPIRRRASGLCAVMVIVLGLVPVVHLGNVPPARAAADRPYVVGEIPLYVPPGFVAPTRSQVNTSLVIDGARRRGYQLLSKEGIGDTADVLRMGAGYTNPRSDRTAITSFDLDSLQVVRTVVVPGVLVARSNHVVDEANGRVFLEELGGGLLLAIAVLDEARFESGHRDPVAHLGVPPRPDNMQPVGIRFEPRTGKLLAVFNPAQISTIAPGSQGVAPLYLNSVAQWDPDRTTGGGRIVEDWWHPLRSCATSNINSITQGTIPALSSDGAAVYVPCGYGDGGLVVLKLPLDPTTGAPSAETTVMSVGGAGMQLVDAVGERVYIGGRASSNGIGSSYVVGYDGRRGRLMGTSVLSRGQNFSNIAGGVDQHSGRLYFVVLPSNDPLAPEKGGLVLVDGRREALPQALVYRDLLFDIDDPKSIVVDSGAAGSPPRLFIPVWSNNRNAWAVVADPVPVQGDPPKLTSEPTSDVDEAAGKTERSYAGESGGYGVRYFTVGGTSRTALLQLLLPTHCLPRERELFTAQVRRASLSSLSAAGEAYGLQADDATKDDLRDVSGCRSGLEALKGKPGEAGWSDSKAECAGNDTGEVTGSGKSARVECRQSTERLAASAVHKAAEVPMVTVGSSSSRSELRRDEKDGLVVEVTSIVDDVRVDLGGANALAIGTIRSVATARSRGRVPKDGGYKRAERRVEFCAIKGPGIESQACRNEAEMATIVERLNSLSARLVFRQPPVDAELLAGTPKGYLAAVQRDRADLGLSRLEMGDDLSVVPALEIQVRNAERPALHRYVVQLAGARAVAAYGINVLPPEVGFVDAPPPDVLPDGAELIDAPASGEAASTALPEAPSLEVPTPGESAGVVTRAVRRLAKAVAVAAGIFLRGPLDSLVLFGIWSTFGLPVYLLSRRQRLGAAR